MKMRKRVLAMIMAGTVAAGCLAGCGSSSGENTASAAGSGAENSADGSGHTVAVVLKTLNSDYWQACAAGIKQAEKDFDCTVNLIGPPSETSYDEQINEIETDLGDTSNEAIVIAPLQPDSTANAVSKAEIPVLAVDTTFESDKLLSYIGVSNKDAAASMAQYAIDQLGSDINVVLLAGVQGDITSSDRMEGYQETIEAAGGKVLEIQYTDAATDKAVTVMEGMIQKYKKGEIDAVLTLSDDVAVGAANACEQAGRDEITVYGFGGISGAEAVRDGVLAASVNINPYEMGYNCVAKALDAINGAELEDFYPTEPEIIDSSNIDDFMVKLAEWTK